MQYFFLILFSIILCVIVFSTLSCVVKIFGRMLTRIKEWYYIAFNIPYRRVKNKFVYRVNRKDK